MGAEQTGGPVNKLRLLLTIARALLKSGLLGIAPRHWLAIARAWRRCGPSFAFLGELAAIRFGARRALCDEWGWLTFLELQQRVEALARYLRHEQRVRAGQQVAIAFSNHRGFVISLLAVTRLGADVLPLNPTLAAEVLRRQLRDRHLDLVLHEPEFEIWAGQHRCLEWSPELQAQGELPPVKRAGQLVVLTSGSTGVSKGIRRRPTLGELLPVGAGLLTSLPLRLNRLTVLAIPFYHGYGIATLAMALVLGSRLLTARRYQIGPLLGQQKEPALLVTVPTLLYRWQNELAESPRPAAIITGSAPLSATLCRNLIERLGPIVYNLYGSTEAGLIALATPSMLAQAPGCVGYPLPGNQVRIQAAPGQIGEVQVKGPLVLQPGSDGWRSTGDLGRFDERGRLFVCGRSDSMIVSGGENVYPHELEEALLQHPEIADCAVLVRDDPEFGQRLEAAVVLQAESTLDAEALDGWLRTRLERFKLPRRIAFLRGIPRNALGKVDRRQLVSLLDT